MFHQLYHAAKAGHLGQGVTVRPEAAAPIIAAFEAMPDEQLRALLAPAARDGAKAGVHWVEPMRKRAQKRLANTNVSDGDVAEELIREALHRKHTLRGSFAGFFTAEGFAGGAKLTKVVA